MTRLIDADALKYEPLPKGDRNYRTYNLDDAYDDGYYAAFTAIRNAPTIDAEPVRHGKWTHDGGYFKNRWICSECGYKWFSTKESGKFCANCGARMDEE